jgi:hypothetical protein
MEKFCTFTPFIARIPTSNQVTDPGRAMITDKCADIGKVKGPMFVRIGRTCTLFS